MNDRGGLIVTFVALLEMIRLKLVRVFQSSLFGPIRVYKRPRPADAPHPITPSHADTRREDSRRQRHRHLRPELGSGLLQPVEHVADVMAGGRQIVIEIHRAECPVSTERTQQKSGEGPLHGCEKGYEYESRNSGYEPRLASF